VAFISGLVSGIDTEALIKQMMELERRPAVLLQQEKSKLQQRSDTYRDVNTRLSNLAARLADLLQSSAFGGKTVTSSDASVVTGTAGASAVNARYDIVVNELATTHRVASDAVADADLGLSGTFRVNDVEIEVDLETSLSELAARINAAGAGVRAMIIGNRLVLESEESGSGNALVLVDVSGGVLEQLGVLNEDATIKNELQAAQDASFSINGIDFVSGSNRISGEVPGVVFTLNSTGSASITISHDVDRAVQAVQAFVDQYNSTLDFISEKTAKGALLQGDAMIIRLASSLHTLAGDRINAPPGFALTSLSMVGISVDRYGVMSLDATKLRDALNERPEEVAKLFAARADVDGYDGIAVRMRSFIETYTKAGSGIISSRRKLFEEQMESIQDSIDRLDRRLQVRERALVRQFTELERVLSTLQGLGTTLSNQIQQLTGFRRPER